MMENMLGMILTDHQSSPPKQRIFTAQQQQHRQDFLLSSLLNDRYDVISEDQWAEFSTSILSLPPSLSFDDETDATTAALLESNFVQPASPYCSESAVNSPAPSLCCSRSPVPVTISSETISELSGDDDESPFLSSTSKPKSANLPSINKKSKTPDESSICCNCGVTKTPLWRRNPLNTSEQICNACGLYFKQYGKHRPINERKLFKERVERACAILESGADHSRPPDDQNLQTNGAIKKKRPHLPGECVNCGPTSSPLWRKTKDHQSICNACGLYFKSYGRHRPQNVRKRQKVHLE